MSKLFKVVTPFENIKLAMLNVEAEDVSKWSVLVDEYLTDKYPSLSSGIRPVNFQSKDPEVGNAIGSAEYNNLGVSLTIPIFIEEFKLKEPDIALKGKKVIPLDIGLINSLSTKEQMEGTVVENPEEDDITDQTEFLTSLFETTDTDQDGNPMYYKGAKTVSKKVAEVYDSLLGADKLFSDRIKKHIKCADTIYEKVEIIKVASLEDENNPYHYNCVVLKKIGGDLKHEYLEDISESELKVLQGKINKEAEWVSFDPKQIDPPKIKVIEEAGTYDISFKKSIVNVPVFTKIFTIESTGRRNIKPLTIVDTYPVKWQNNGDVDNETSGNNIGLPESGKGVFKKSDKMTGWMYDKVYGVRNDNNDRFPMSGGAESGTHIDLRNITDIQDYVGEHITFYADGGKISSPYKVVKAMSYALGEKREQIIIIDVESIATKSKLSLWLDCQVDRPLKGNIRKMQHNKYKAVTDTAHPLWLIPTQYRVMLLPGKREVPVKPRDYYGNYFKDEFGKYDKELILTTSNYNPTKVDIKITEDEKDPVVVSEVGKIAADMYIQHFMGRDDVTINMLQKDKGYLIAKTAEEPPMKTISKVALFKDYRGEWLKLAYVILNNEDISKYSKAIAKDPTKYRSVAKVAEMESLVDDLVGLEYVDNDNIGDTNDVEYGIENIMDKIGQLLMLSRMGKNNIPENILMRAMKALTKLLNEIRGNEPEVG